jgi:hypothetical protein
MSLFHRERVSCAAKNGSLGNGPDRTSFCRIMACGIFAPAGLHSSHCPSGREVEFMAKTSVSFAQFFYRVNPDTTIDAICGYCFLTVATANTRTELRLRESAHHCRNSLSKRAAVNRLDVVDLKGLTAEPTSSIFKLERLPRFAAAMATPPLHCSAPSQWMFRQPSWLGHWLKVEWRRAFLSFV